MRIRIAVFFVIISFFVKFIGASPVDEITLVKANEAFTRTAKIKKIKAEVKVEPMEQLSRKRVAPWASPTPEAPRTQMWFMGISEENDVRIGLDVITSFPPVNPMRTFVNGSRTDVDAVFQTTLSASPGSPYKMTGMGVAELHGLEILLPGKLGFNAIETQVDWNQDFYHSSWYEFLIDHLGAIAQMCVNADGSVNVTFVFDTFDKEFPSSVQITMNDIPLVPQGEVTIEKEGFLNYVSMTLSNEAYAELSVKAYEAQEASFILRGDNEVVIQWQDYLPWIQELPSCDCGYNSNNGEPVPCG